MAGAVLDLECTSVMPLKFRDEWAVNKCITGQLLLENLTTHTQILSGGIRSFSTQIRYHGDAVRYLSARHLYDNLTL